MPDWVLNRTTVIGLAILGGILSMLASWCQARGSFSQQVISRLNRASYAFMTVSIMLFIAAGMFGAEN